MFEQCHVTCHVTYVFNGDIFPSLVFGEKYSLFSCVQLRHLLQFLCSMKIFYLISCVQWNISLLNTRVERTFLYWTRERREHFFIEHESRENISLLNTREERTFLYWTRERREHFFIEHERRENISLLNKREDIYNTGISSIVNIIILVIPIL
jgi:hypothetical protein